MHSVPPAVLLGPVFDALPVGVIVLDEHGKVRVFNQYEERLANRKRERVLGHSFFDEVAPCMNVRELAGEFFDKVGKTAIDARVEFTFPFPHADQPRDVVVRMQSLVVDREPHALLLVEDVSAQRAVERLKETLATLLVHDFKNPLSVIQSNLDFIRGTLLPAQKPALEALDDSLLATRRLHAMVLNLLDIARMETGSFPLTRIPTDVAKLVAEAVRASTAIGRDAEVEIVADVAGALEARLDGAAVRRALANLIENALRHSPRGSRVVVSAQAEGSSMVFRVADEGPGVPAPLRDAIFEKFAQGDVQQRTANNRGLGLTFVRMVARAHGGEVTVTDTIPHGATFVLRLLAD